MRRPNTTKTVFLNLGIDEGLFTLLHDELYSPIEGRVPHGAYKRFFDALLRWYFTEKLHYLPKE